MLPNASVTNEMFLRAVCGEDWTRAHVAGFLNDPANAPRSVWAGRLAGQGLPSLPAAGNNYFVVSTFKPGRDGRASRRKELFQATHIIVLDDVAEKLKPGSTLAALGAPSYRLETSPGSEQWGYILTRPETSMARVDALVAGLIASGLNPAGTDPGMKGVTRYVRLPVGRNTKAKCGPDGFQCVLHEWCPERRFTLDALAAPLEIDLDSAPPARAIRVRRAGERDLVCEALDLLGLVKGQAAEGWLDITCPFIHEHTDRADSGTGYSLTGGGFKCNHGHCADRQTPAFKAELMEMLVAAGHGHWFAREDFLSVDNAALAALRALVRDQLPIPPALAGRLACVPARTIARELAGDAVVYGTDPKPIRAAISRARRAWPKKGAPSRLPLPVVALPLPADYRQPVTLDEQQAEMAGVLAAFAPGPAAAERAPLVRRQARGAAGRGYGAP